MRPDAPPDLRVLRDRAGVVEEADEALVVRPRGERVGDATTREEAREDLCPRRVEAAVHPFHEGRARREREQLREEVAHRGDDTDRPIGAPDRDVDVEPERVVAPDHVAEELVVSAVVRRVDDALLLPVGPGMCPGRAEQEPHRLHERLQLGAALGHRGRHVRERLLAPRPDLDLGRDELADEVLLETGAARRRLDVLEAARQVERVADRGWRTPPRRRP